MNMNIRRKLMGSFAAVLLLTMIVGAVSWTEMNEMNDSYETLISDRVAKILLIKDLKHGVVEQGKHATGYMLTGNTAYLDWYESERTRFSSNMKALQEVQVLDEAIRLASKLESLEEQYAEAVSEIVSYRQAGDMNRVIRMVEEDSSSIVQQIELTASELEAFQRKQMETTLAETAGEVRMVQVTVLATVIAALLAGIVLSLLVTRAIARPVKLVAQAARRIADGDLRDADLHVRQRDEIGQLAGAFNEMKRNLSSLMLAVHHNAAQVAAASKELSEHSAQAVQASNHIAEAVQGISQSADHQASRMRDNKQGLEDSSTALLRIAQSATSTAESSEEAIQQAEGGKRLLADTAAQMRNVQMTMEQSAEAVYNLGEQSRQIHEITQFIREIAEQTNLLALNASIEAARAGEHGQGFAVVAAEVKKLADQAGEASSQVGSGIDRMVGTINQAVEAMRRGGGELQAGTSIMNRTGEAFDAVYDAIRHVAAQAEEVSAATEELSAVTGQLLESEHQVAELSEHISGQSQTSAAVCEEQLASMEEVAVSADSLNRMAQQLREELGKFKLNQADTSEGLSDESKS
ncbi:methyl-accepting chemotaxis protein [Paenibacillus sambharensis]|nr:methyl-accepting chemotaxis protein [Paenibacillus sambharensis]